MAQNPERESESECVCELLKPPWTLRRVECTVHNDRKKENDTT